MFSRNACFVLALASSVAWAAANDVQRTPLGRVPTPAEVALWDIDVMPDGAGLPSGMGTVAQGQEVYNANCAGCHGAGGQDGIKDRLAGGVGSLERRCRSRR